ncbi:unnamed protein product, partial [Timema podura]|nr:unnamed protein product [Timema podura]
MVADKADEVVLETEITNRPALRLYENLGFVRDKRLFRYYLNGVDALRLNMFQDNQIEDLTMLVYIESYPFVRSQSSNVSVVVSYCSSLLQKGLSTMKCRRICLHRFGLAIVRVCWINIVVMRRKQGLESVIFHIHLIASKK